MGRKTYFRDTTQIDRNAIHSTPPLRDATGGSTYQRLSSAGSGVFFTQVCCRIFTISGSLKTDFRRYSLHQNHLKIYHNKVLMSIVLSTQTALNTHFGIIVRKKPANWAMVIKRLSIPSASQKCSAPPLGHKGRLFAFFKAPLLYKGELSAQLTEGI